MPARLSPWARLAAALPAPPREPWLPALLARNAQVDYLRRHGSPQDAAAFRDRLPLVSYADLAPWFDDIQRGRADQASQLVDAGVGLQLGEELFDAGIVGHRGAAPRF